jgi:hemerythrin
MLDRNTAAHDSTGPTRADLHAAAERLVEAVRAGRRDEVAPLADRLAAVARARFEAEERALAAREDVTLVRHAHEHRQFLADVAAIAELARRGDDAAVDAMKPAEFIPAWLAAHAKTDQGLAAPARVAAA